jgi:hypothetical protein
MVAAVAAAAAVSWFHSPSGNIECEVAARSIQGTHAYCQTFTPARSATLDAAGRTRVCRGTGCLGNGPENAFTLRYGRSVTVGPFRCTSLVSGMRCVVVRSGRGFLISRQGVRRF